MAGEYDFVPQTERELGEEKLYQQIRQDKELADLRSGLDSLQIHFSQGDYYSRRLIESEDRTDVLIGDYGYMRSFTNDYLLNLIFRNLRVQDQGGQTLSVDGLINLATNSQDENPRFKFEGASGGQITMDFFSGKNNPNFNCWLNNLSKETKASLISNLESAPPKIWARNIVQQLSEQADQILNHNGQFTLPLFNGDVISPADLTYFLDSYGFDPAFGWTQEQVEAILAGGEIQEKRGSEIEQWVDPATQEKWVKMHNRARKGISLALRKQGTELFGNILIDTDVLRGRDTDSKFLDSLTSREILSVFEKLGLEPKDEMLNDFTEGSLGFGYYKDRYGNGYADLSRLVTYVVREGSGIERLININDPNFTPEKLEEQASKLSAPAKLILEMMAAVMKRGMPEQAQRFHIGSFSGQSIRDGSCKDSEAYFSGSLGLGRSFQDGVFIYKSGYGADTKINRVKIVADGVEFPPGYLFRVSGEQVLEPLRATMYCFNNDEARDAFGWQYKECLANDPSLESAIDAFPLGWDIPSKA